MNVHKCEEDDKGCEVMIFESVKIVNGKMEITKQLNIKSEQKFDCHVLEAIRVKLGL